MKTEMLIDNKWIGIDKHRSSIKLINPASEEVFACVPEAKSEDIIQAIQASHEAFPKWSGLSPANRGDILRKASEIVIQRSEELGELITMEMGKPVEEAKGEVLKAGTALRYYAEEGERVFGRIIRNENADFESYVYYEPLGVVAAITPWNYPIELLCWKLAGALAAGCTMVAKPASITPLSSVNFLKCLVDAGLPKGVINMVFGRGDAIGKEMIRNPLIKKVAFTGSTEVGRKIVSLCQANMTKYSVELGGQCPAIVCRSADIDRAVADTVRRSFRNMGQICIAINRIYIHEEIYNDFQQKFREETKKLILGDSLDNPNVHLGPMSSRQGIIKILDHIDDAMQKGAKIIYGGKSPKGMEKGFFFQPTIIADTNHNMKVMREESFGPLVGLMPFRTREEACHLANDTEYGLASYVFTKDLNEADVSTRNLGSGHVAINNPDAGVMNAPYGGWKNSGDGYEHGPEGMMSYFRIKHVRKRLR